MWVMMKEEGLLILNPFQAFRHDRDDHVLREQSGKQDPHHQTVFALPPLHVFGDQKKRKKDASEGDELLWGVGTEYITNTTRMD